VQSLHHIGCGQVTFGPRKKKTKILLRPKRIVRQFMILPAYEQIMVHNFLCVTHLSLCWR
jgi:hypothetical protein